MKEYAIGKIDESTKLRTKKIAYKVTGILWKIFRAALLIGLSFVILYPLIYAITMTFRPADQIYDPTVVWISKTLTLDNLKTTFQLMDYPKALLNSLMVNVISSFLQVAICAFTSYGFARFEFKGKNILFGLVLLTVLVPPQVIITPSFLTYKTLGLVNTYWTFYLPAIFGAGIKSGLFIFIFRQFFRGLPKELEEAAAIDGCGFFQCFIRIIIPTAGAVILTTVLLSIMWYWNDYYMSSMYMNNMHTVTTALVNLETNTYNITGDIAPDPYKIITYMQAGSLLVITPPLLLYLVLQRKFVQGAERSGIVG